MTWTICQRHNTLVNYTSPTHPTLPWKLYVARVFFLLKAIYASFFLIQVGLLGCIWKTHKMILMNGLIWLMELVELSKKHIYEIYSIFYNKERLYWRVIIFFPLLMSYSPLWDEAFCSHGDFSLSFPIFIKIACMIMI